MDQLSPLNRHIKLQWYRVKQRLYAASSDRILAGLGLSVLLATVAYWAWLGARLHLSNADQLSDPYMFDSGATFKVATFPSAHTFLLKWPIFWMLHSGGITRTSLIFATVMTVVITIGALAAILRK